MDLAAGADLGGRAPGVLPEVLPDAALRPPPPRELLGVQRVQDDERLAKDVDVVVAEGAHRVGEHVEHLLGRPVAEDAVRALAREHRHRVRAARAAALLVERRPGGVRRLLGDAEGVLARVGEGRLVRLPRRGPPEIPEREPHRAADGGVRAIAVAEDAVARVEAELARDRPSHDHERHAHVGRLADAVQIVRGVEERLQGGEDHREMLGPAAAHHRVDRELLDRRGAALGRDQAEALLGVAPGVLDQRLDAAPGGEDDREAVGPPAREAELDRLLVVGGRHYVRYQVHRGASSSGRARLSGSGRRSCRAVAGPGRLGGRRPAC